MIEPFAKIVNDFLFLYPMKTLENQRFSDVYRGNRNGKPFTFFIKSSLIDVWQDFRNLEFVIALFFKFRAHMPKFEHFGPKSINFLILTNFCLNPILTMLISNLIFVFENLTPNSQIWTFWVKSINKSILHLP